MAQGALAAVSGAFPQAGSRAPYPLGGAMERIEISADAQASKDEARLVVEGLRRHNASHVPDLSVTPLYAFLRSEAGRLLGGLLGYTLWQWLQVEAIWVSEAHRRRGHASALLVAAESEATRRGCRASLLDTFSFQAAPLYEKLGYRRIGTVADFPPGHERYYMVKTLV